MIKTFIKSQEDVLFYVMSFITVLCSLVAAISQSLLPALIPLFILATYFVVVDIKMVYFLLIGLLSVSTEIDLPGGLSTDLPGEPIMWIVTISFFLIALTYPKNIEVPIRNPITLLLILHVVWILFAAITADRMGVAFKFFLAKIWYVIPFYFVPFIYLKDKVISFLRSNLKLELSELLLITSSDR